MPTGLAQRAPSNASAAATNTPRPCPGCGSAVFHLHVCFSGHPDEDFLRCHDCDLIRRRATPDAVTLSAAYQDEYYAPDTAARFLGPAEWLARLFRRWRVRQVRPWLPLPPARILDVGCGRGVFLASLQARGYNVAGTQLSQTAAASIRHHFGFEVFVGDLPDVPWPAGSFDVITVWHVLEHMPDPARALRDMARLLKPDGVLIVEVPNAGGWSVRLFGRHWLHWDAPHHLVHFSRPVLERLLVQHGFTPLAWQTTSWEYGPSGILLSLLNLLPGPPNLLFDALRSGSHRPKPDVRLAIHVLAALFLLPVACLLFAVTVSCGRGDVLRAVCRLRAPQPGSKHAQYPSSSPRA
ncbi:MAG: class I SAM-dependent methyltransferase [bacterium]